jgi:putative DNA-invertase from lambdoid prophage Rac
MAKTAFLYLRTSTDRQGELGISAQKLVGEELYKAHVQKEYPELVILADEDCSARQNEFQTRPKAKELMLRITPEDCVIFPKLDRGFRNLRDLLNVMHLFDRLGIRTFSPDFGIGQVYDSKSLIGKMSLVIFGLAAEIEGHRCSQRSHDFNASQRKMGRATNVAPYGFKIVRRGEPTGAKRQPPAWLQPDDYEQEIMRFCDTYHKKGFGFNKIARHLNENGKLRRNGTPWVPCNLYAYHRKWLKVVDFEIKLAKIRGHRLKEWEFITPAGTLCTRFDKEHLKKEAEDAT